jgi:hypothetical protein
MRVLRSGGTPGIGAAPTGPGLAAPAPLPLLPAVAPADPPAAVGVAVGAPVDVELELGAAPGASFFEPHAAQTSTQHMIAFRIACLYTYAACPAS